MSKLSRHALTFLRAQYFALVRKAWSLGLACAVTSAALGLATPTVQATEYTQTNINDLAHSQFGASDTLKLTTDATDGCQAILD